MFIEPDLVGYSCRIDWLSLEKLYTGTCYGQPETGVSDKEKNMAAVIDFTIPFGYSDVVFIVEDKRIHATKAILAMYSPVFEDMFEEEKEEIALENVEYESFLELMKVVHPPPKEINGDNVRQILPLGAQYEMTYVVEQCERYLESEEPSVANLLLAETYDLPKLTKRIEKWAVDIPISDLKEEPGFNELKRTALTDILILKLENSKP